MSIAPRLLLTVLMLAVLPTLGALALTHASIARAQQAEADRDLAALRDSIIAHLHHLQERLLEQTRSDARIPQLRDFLAGDATQQAQQRAATEQVLLEVGVKDPVFVHSCALIDRTGRNVADSRPELRGSDEGTAAYLAHGWTWADGNAWIAGVATPPGGQRPFLHVVAPVRDSDGTVLGLLRCRLEPALLQALIADEADPGGGRTAVLIDPDGAILADSAAPERRGARWMAAGADGWRSEPRPRMRVTSAACAPTGWTLAVEQAEAAWSAPQRALRRTMLWTYLGSAVVLVVACVVAARSLSSPIRRLAATSRRIADGADERLPAHGVQELRSLADDMNRMLDALADERRRREAASASLAAREAFYRGIFEAAPDAVLVLENGSIIDANARAGALFGLPHTALAGTTPLTHAPLVQPDGEASSAAVARMLAAADGGLPATVTWTGRRADGRDFPCEISLIGIGSGRHLAFVRDLSGLRQLQEQVRQAHKMDALGQLAGGVAHDFNNMLTAMLCSADMIREKSERDDLRRLAGNIVLTAQRAAGLTSKLLSFSRKGKIVSTPVDLHAVIGDAMELLRRSIDRRIDVRTELAATAATVIGDPAQLQSALLNLAINARDAMPDGGVLHLATRTIELDAAAIRDVDAAFRLMPGPHVEVRLTDTGTGIAPEVLPRIFEPFFTTKEVGKGTGLGLSAVYGTMVDHRGAITVSSTPGNGATFRLLLPVASGATPRRPPSDGPVARGNGRILLIDDEDLLREAARAQLEDLGYSVSEARDGIEAEDVFRRAPCDAVLLDQVMPRRSGIETFAALRAIDPQVVVVLCSGFPRSADIGDLLADGMFAFLQKPYDRLDLAAQAAAAVAERRRRRPA